MEKQRSNFHVPLCAAAATAYGYLVTVRDFYDLEHFNACLNLMASALAHLAPVFATDEATGQHYLIDELKVAEGRFQRGATVLVLSDGSRLRGLSIRRQDAREAFVILKTLGLDGIGIKAAARKLPSPEEDLEDGV
jgi:hypothetical protein